VSVTWFVLKHVVAVAVTASTALAVGLPCVRHLSMYGFERVTFAMAVGLAVAGHAALTLGLAGRLEPITIAALVVAAHVAAWSDLADLRERIRGRGDLRTRRSWWLAAAAIVGGGPFVLCAFYPPHAFDETLYHLPFARAFARDHGLVVLPDLRFPVFPQFTEILFAVVLQWAGDVAIHGVSLIATLVTAALVAAWAYRASERAGHSGEAAHRVIGAAMAAAILLGEPIGVYLASTAHVEPTLALFAVAAAYGAHRWRTDGDRRWLILAALLAGTAASTKYLGLLMLAAVSIDIAFLPARRRSTSDVLMYAGVAAAAAALTYGRLVYHTGNPVFPFFTGLFGSSPWAYAEFVRPSGFQHGLQLLMLPWDVVARRQLVGDLPPFSPLLWLALPMAAVGSWWNPQARISLAYAVGFVLVAPTVGHYLWTAVPFLALAGGVSCSEAIERLRHASDRLRSSRLMRVAWAAVIMVFLPGWSYAVLQLVRMGPMPSDADSRADFLSARLPLLPAVRALNERCRGRCTVYALHAEHMGDFSAGRFLGDWNGPASFARTVPPEGDPEEFRRRLRRLGVDYLLVPTAVRSAMPGSGADPPGFRRIYSDRASDVYAVVP
jgi:hypothetical protein